MKNIFILIGEIIVGLGIFAMIVNVIMQVKEECVLKKEITEAIRGRKRTFKLRDVDDERLEEIKKAESFNGDIEKWEG